MQEAKDAGIPVIITDRTIKTEDESLYVTLMGSDFREEGKKAGRWLIRKMKGTEGDINIVELQGTVGSSPAIQRKEGFEEVIKGYEAMEELLKLEDNKIDVLYSHNDDMAIGAIKAIEEYGLKPGKDIIIVSIDANRGAFEKMIEGKMMSCWNIVLMFSSLKYNEQYDTIVSNITEANSINGTVKTSIDSEMWDIVAGKIEFEDGKQYEIINEVNENIRKIMKNVSSKESRVRLDVTLRTMETLKHYVDLLGEQISQKKKVVENEKVLEEIRGVSALVEEDIQEFILYEVKSCETVKRQIQKNVNRWVVTNIIVLFIVLLFSIGAAWFISGSISNPIRELRKMAASIAEGNLNARVVNKNRDEIASLGVSLNIMAGELKELIENSIEEQENLKKSELKALQAQINPHFLYNTLDTIVWMAEANKSEQVIEIVRALSNFFRITLSKGRDWIDIRDEVEHTRSYLIIQKIRYRDILDFKIDVDEDILNYEILKLTLQPIVENALYHGIKNKRLGGTIVIRGSKTDDGLLLFEIVDNGMGMTEEKLREMQSEFDNEKIEPALKEMGFGLSNVHKRIKLYYGKQYGITVKSEYNKGTHVSLSFPCER